MAKVNFTAARVGEFVCPDGKAQAFLWSTKAPGLALRATSSGARAYVFQSRLRDGQSVRMTIGEPLREDGKGTWSIPKAEAEARRLQGLVDQGRDPRREKATGEAEDRAVRASDFAAGLPSFSRVLFPLQASGRAMARYASLSAHQFKNARNKRKPSSARAGRLLVSRTTHSCTAAASISTSGRARSGRSGPGMVLPSARLRFMPPSLAKLR